MWNLFAKPSPLVSALQELKSKLKALPDGGCQVCIYITRDTEEEHSEDSEWMEVYKPSTNPIPSDSQVREFFAEHKKNAVCMSSDSYSYIKRAFPAGFRTITWETSDTILFSANCSTVKGWINDEIRRLKSQQAPPGYSAATRPFVVGLAPERPPAYFGPLAPAPASVAILPPYSATNAAAPPRPGSSVLPSAPPYPFPGTASAAPPK